MVSDKLSSDIIGFLVFVYYECGSNFSLPIFAIGYIAKDMAAVFSAKDR